MSKLTVTLSKQVLRAPSGITFDHTDIDVTDAAGIKASQAVNGSESPSWVGVFQIANEGKGSVVATDKDTAGNPIGSPITVEFDTLAGTFQATNGVSVSIE